MAKIENNFFLDEVKWIEVDLLDSHRSWHSVYSRCVVPFVSSCFSFLLAFPREYLYQTLHSPFNRRGSSGIWRVQSI